VIDIQAPQDQWVEEQIDIAGCEVVHFLGNKVSASVSWGVPTIIVPDNPNYPDVDVLLYDPKTHSLLAVQFTVTNPLKHSRNFFILKDGGVLSELWKSKSNGQIQDIKMLWATVTKDIRDPKFNGDLVVVHTELETQFSELRGFVI